MKLKNKEITLNGKNGSIYIKRNNYGIPEIKAADTVMV